MAHPTAVINVVGLSRSLIGPDAPHIGALAGRGRLRALAPVFPAVTTTVQSSMLTGAAPSAHGIVGNGWYDRDMAEVQFWKQSNRLVQGEKVWETARRRDPSITACNMFWWYNMHSTADLAVTPRPMYPADGRKLPDVYSRPADLRHALQAELGQFPLFKFWGPAASIESTAWIARATERVWDAHRPTLTLVYLPHLDYGLQKLGPDHPEIPEHVRAVDAEVGRLVDFFEARGVRVVLVSEYGIEPATGAVHVNRALREDGAIAVRDELGRELLDAGASDAFAVADHQVAHVYVRDPASVERYAALCAGLDGVARAMAGDARAAAGIDHARAGDVVLEAAPGRWFSYYYWLDDDRAPDFARTVDIHRKPGYDPVELFLDPALALPRLRIGLKLLRRKLGFRGLLDVIPLDASLVRGTHGRTGMDDALAPVVIAAHGLGDGRGPLPCTAVRDLILAHLFDDDATPPAFA